MRMIDADKAERDIEELRKSDWFNAPYLTRERKLGLSEAFDMIQGVCIKHAPTVDAEPVRHGRWIEDGSFKYKHGGRNSEAKELFGTEWRTMRRIKCSLCNKITLVDDTILYEYCPHCGAKMDVEQKKSYFPKGFFSKERPLAKGDKHDSD